MSLTDLLPSCTVDSYRRCAGFGVGPDGEVLAFLNDFELFGVDAVDLVLADGFAGGLGDVAELFDPSRMHWAVGSSAGVTSFWSRCMTIADLLW